MTEYNADKAQENAAREEATHEESMHNKTTQEKAAQKKAAQEVTGSEQRKAEEEALKKRLALRVTAPGYKYPWHRWAIPVAGETTAGTGAILIPVMVGQFINQHIAGKAPDAWPMFWVVVAAITFIVINEFFGWGTSMTLSAELSRDWRIYINRLMGRTRAGVDSGEAVTVMNKDVRRITDVYFSLPLFVNAMIIATLGAVQLWLINPVTAIVTLIGTLIVVGVIAWYSSFLESKIGEYREKDGEASSRASDIATGLRTIAGLGAEEQMRERYHRGTDEVFDSYMRYEKTHRWMFLIRALLGGAVTLLGIGFALTGHVENGRWGLRHPRRVPGDRRLHYCDDGRPHLDYPELPHRMAIRQDCARQGRPSRRSRGRTPGRAEEPAHRRRNGAAGTRRTGSRGKHP